jgi:hypothetical protein
VLVCTALTLTACSSTSDAPSSTATLATPSSVEDTPEVTGTVVVTVDCGDEGVADVKVMNRATKLADALVGRNPRTQAAGGRPIFSEHYEGQAGSLEALLIVTTSPTYGSCKTTLTNYQTGELIAQRESTGQVILEVAARPSLR